MRMLYIAFFSLLFIGAPHAFAAEKFEFAFGGIYPNFTLEPDYGTYGCRAAWSYATTTLPADTTDFPYTDDPGLIGSSGLGFVCDGGSDFLPGYGGFNLPDGVYLFEFSVNHANPFNTLKYTYVSLVDGVARAILGYTASSSVVTFGNPAFEKSCNLFNDDIATLYINTKFSLSDCLFELFYPAPGAFTGVFADAQSGFLSAAPWGYITHLLDLVNGTATTSLPVLSYQFATSSVLGATTLSFDFAGAMTDATAIINATKSTDAGQKTVWEILMPIISAMIYLFVLLQVVHELMGMHTNKHETV